MHGNWELLAKLLSGAGQSAPRRNPSGASKTTTTAPFLPRVLWRRPAAIQTQAKCCPPAEPEPALGRSSSLSCRGCRRSCGRSGRRRTEPRRSCRAPGLKIPRRKLASTSISSSSAHWPSLCPPRYAPLLAPRLSTAELRAAWRWARSPKAGRRGSATRPHGGSGRPCRPVWPRPSRTPTTSRQSWRPQMRGWSRPKGSR